MSDISWAMKLDKVLLKPVVLLQSVGLGTYSDIISHMLI